jgi:hypothetical protein
LEVSPTDNPTMKLSVDDASDSRKASKETYIGWHDPTATECPVFFVRPLRSPSILRGRRSIRRKMGELSNVCTPVVKDDEEW